MPYQVFQITAPSKALLRGDTEYTTTLTDRLHELGIDAQYIRGADDVSIDRKALMEEIHRRRPSKDVQQIVHLQLRPPNGGTLFSPEQLHNFDHSVVTVHEFASLPHDSGKMQALEYMQAADHVIFTTPDERRAAAEYMPEVLDKSSVIPVFPAMPTPAINKKDPSKMWRPNNIISFGSIRSGRGYDQVIELARLIKEDPELATLKRRNPIKNNLEIIVAGSTQNPLVIRQLVQAIYGLGDEQMPPLTGKTTKDKFLILEKLGELEEKGAKKQLPIELRFNVSREDLPALFERSNFAYLPIERGATCHSSAVPTMMASGCITITTQGEQTPKELKGGAVLFASDAAEALDVIKQRLDAPRMNADTRKKALAYVENLSPESAALKYAAIYNAVAKSRHQSTPEEWQARIHPPYQESQMPDNGAFLQ